MVPDLLPNDAESALTWNYAERAQEVEVFTVFYCNYFWMVKSRKVKKNSSNHLSQRFIPINFGFVICNQMNILTKRVI